MKTDPLERATEVHFGQVYARAQFSGGWCIQDDRYLRNGETLAVGLPRERAIELAALISLHTRCRRGHIDEEQCCFIDCLALPGRRKLVLSDE